jgi:hypothetical protein
MLHRIRVVCPLFVLTCVGVVALARPLTAQEPRVFIKGGDKVAIGGTSPISDEAIRSLIQAHMPEELQQTDARLVLLVVDANDEYVSGHASKATVITAEPGSAAFVVADSAGGAAAGPIVIRRTTTGNSADGPGFVVSGLSSKMEGAGGSGVFGSGYSLSEISAIGVRRFTAGQLGTSALVVSVVKLKS